MVSRLNESFVLLDLLYDDSPLFQEDYSVGLLLKERNGYRPRCVFG